MFKALSNFMLPRKICAKLGHEREVFTGEVLKLSSEDAKGLLEGGYISALKEEPKEPKETEPTKRGKK